MNTVYDDKELIYKLSKNDRKAYKHIYTTYYNGLCIYLLSFTHDDYLAEDITQNVLLMLWEKRNKLKIHTSIKNYLFKSAYNLFIDDYRFNQKINKKLEAIKFDALNKIKENEDDKKLMEQRLLSLESAISELPPRCKEILKLSKIEGYKYKEISKMLNISIKTVENHMSNAFKLLKKKMLNTNFLLFFLRFSFIK